MCEFEVQVVEHVGYGQKRPFCQLPRLSCKNDKALRKAEVLACRFDTPYYTSKVLLTYEKSAHQMDWFLAD